MRPSITVLHRAADADRAPGYYVEMGPFEIGPFEDEQGAENYVAYLEWVRGPDAGTVH